MGWKGLLTLAIVIVAVGGIALALHVFPTTPQQTESAASTTSSSTFPSPPTGSSTPPVYIAGAQQRVECTGVDGGIAHLDQSELLAPPPAGAKWSYDWYEGQHYLAHGERANVTLALGVHDVEVVARSLAGVQETAYTRVTVADTIAPTITVASDSPTASPADGRMIPVTFSIGVRDACDGAASWILDSVTGAVGSGGVQGAAFGTADNQITLRADATTYTVMYSTTDASGNVARASTTVTIAN